MMIRHGFWRLAGTFLLALCLLGGCSDDDAADEPPRAEIVHPQSGDHLVVDPDSVLVIAEDDRGIVRVEISMNDQLLTTVRQVPYKTFLPLGIHADGRPHVLMARAYDTRGQTGDATPVTITIDPSLQTVPQITSLQPAPDDEHHLRLAWLPWPLEHGSFMWEVAPDDGFFHVTHSGSLADTTVQIPLGPESLAYARVKVSDNHGTSAWSRTARYSGLQTWRRRIALPGSQLGAAVHLSSDYRSLFILSHGLNGHPVTRSDVRMLTVGARGDTLKAHVHLLDSTHSPTNSLMTPDEVMMLVGRRTTGNYFVAAADPGGLLWKAETQIMHATALVQTDQGQLLAVGADRQQGRAAEHGLFALVSGHGTLLPVGVFRLLPAHEVRRAWVRPDGGFVLAGQVFVDASGAPGGIWAMGLGALEDGAHEVLWTVRLGSADRWLFCGAGTDGNGNYVIAGAARHTELASRYGFLAGIDQQGRVRWQVTDRNWQQFSGVAADVGGRWVAVGARRQHLGDQRYEYATALRGLSSFGTTRWESVHRAGHDAQAWALTPHPHGGGGWYVAGARHDGAANYDLDLLRVDDRGELP